VLDPKWVKKRMKEMNDEYEYQGNCCTIFINGERFDLNPDDPRDREILDQLNDESEDC